MPCRYRIYLLSAKSILSYAKEEGGAVSIALNRDATRRCQLPGRQEQEENARPELTTHIENLDGYDTIFIGYPNWWADLPMAVYSFFDEYDFSGKTIIPFNVHNGSRFSRTIQTIQELEPDATVVEDGFTVSEQTVAEAAEDVAAWLEGLGY